ncbi:hypothetical protein J8273_1523 [Carpediemonas membranifera]|uniref:Uncharacterized protein n=1 Tax=Carpediemonas membranifera TaxID=201153 RepID=A0A8J6B1M6_9EUKA|nr:hypothetical protein J8273_1523 [Carpediemonas membranifera]|eukprot:KAG9396525.1 hypothetical protein J8273_1523 [Carpediemonas membranifera]
MAFAGDYSTVEEYIQDPISFERCIASRFALLCSISRHGTGDWVAVASNVDAMDNRQCRERYEIHEKPSLSFAPPSREELLDLAELYFTLKQGDGNRHQKNIYCELRERTFTKYRRSNMWLKQLFMRMEKSSELDGLHRELVAVARISA